MKKRNKKYNPKKTEMFKNRIRAMFALDGHKPLSQESIDRFIKRYAKLEFNLQNKLSDINDMMYLHGLLSQIDIIRKNSNKVEEMDNYEFVLSIVDKVLKIVDRFHSVEPRVNVGFDTEEEKQGVQALFNIAIKTFKTLTNREYDNFICDLEQKCYENGDDLTVSWR